MKSVFNKLCLACRKELPKFTPQQCNAEWYQAFQEFDEQLIQQERAVETYRNARQFMEILSGWGVRLFSVDQSFAWCGVVVASKDGVRTVAARFHYRDKSQVNGGQRVNWECNEGDNRVECAFGETDFSKEAVLERCSRIADLLGYQEVGQCH